MDYQYIIDYLSATVGPSIKDIGDRASKVDKYDESVIQEAFRRYIIGEKGDTGNGFFKANPDDDACYVFNGRYFEHLKDRAFCEMVRLVMQTCGVGIVYYNDSAKRISDYNIERLMESKRTLAVPDRRYVCFENCVLDTVTGEVHEHDSKYFTDIILNFSYDKDAKSALWDKVLMQTVPDEGMRRTLQQFCGAFFIDRSKHRFEHACFVVGEGQNGKSVICNAIVNVLKNEDETGQQVTKCITTFTPEQLFRSAQMDYHMAEVNGKIVNYCDDVSDKDFSGGDFKAFVSGQEFIGRSPYSREMTRVTKIPLLLCCANRIPPTTDDSEGYYRRFLIINCPNKVDERDKDIQLNAKLATDENRQAIFNWMYEGFRQLMKNDFKIEISESVKDMREQMKADSNSARRWIKESGLVPGKEDVDWKSLKEWMAEYKQYCEDYGEHTRGVKNVTKMFDELGFPKKRMGSGTWYCIGRKSDVPRVSAADLTDDDEGGFDNIPF